MNTRTALYAATLAAAALALTACDADAGTSSKPSAPATTAAPSPTQPAPGASESGWDEALAKAGIPKRPTGAERQQLLDDLAKAAPDTVRYEDKAIDAARNQCSAINGEGVKRPDWLAAQRFTYKDVTTTEAQGKAINDALKASGFCNV